MAERIYGLTLAYTGMMRRRPTVPVTLTYLRTTRSFDGLVDSGAERTVCSIAVAEEAGVDLTEFPTRRIRGAGGFSRSRLCPMDLTILGRRVPTEVLVVETNIILLGRNDVFRAFQFGFDERAELQLVEPYET